MTILLLVPYLSLWTVSFSCCVEEQNFVLRVVSCRRSHMLGEFSWFSSCCQAAAWTDWEEAVSWAQGVMLLGSQSAELKKKSSGAMITLWRTSRRGDFWLSSSMVHMANARAQVVWLSQHSKPQRSCILCDPRSVSLAPKPNYTRPSTAVQIT